jgi:hypothetical protein
LVGDADHQLAFEYEASGYPKEPGGITQEAFRIARLAGRVAKENKDDAIVELATIEAIEAIEQKVAASRIALEAARDASISITSSNPHQYVHSPQGNQQERIDIRIAIGNLVAVLASRKAFVHR